MLRDGVLSVVEILRLCLGELAAAHADGQPGGCGRRYRWAMSYEDFAIAVVRVIEGVGGGIMVVGGLVAFARYVRQVVAHASDPYRQLRANIGRVILLGLEVLIIADIIRTIVVDQSLQSVGVLALIVGIRIVLSFSLEVEIDGAWPWNGWRLQSADRTTGSRTPG